MQSLLDSPFTPILAASVPVGLILALLARLVRPYWAAGLTAPVVFLTAYYQTYDKIPSFPPLGATNKIFYIVLAATVLGLLLDLVIPAIGSAGHGGIALVGATLIAGWIGLSRFAAAGPDLWATVVALILGGALLLWRLATLETRAGWILFAVLPAAFAPIALFGGSSTSVGLCLGLFAGLGVAALVNLRWPRRLGFAGVLGAGAGLLAMTDTVTLITQRTDPLALACFLAVPFAGQFGASLLLPRNRLGPGARAVAMGLMAASPIVAILAILILRHDSPL